MCDILKKCSKCGEEKPLDGFYKDNRYKHGVYSSCKECFLCHKKEYAKLYIKKRREIVSYKQYDQQYHKQYNQNNKEKLLEYSKQYQINNRDRVNTIASKRRARKRNALHTDHNPQIELVLRQSSQRLSQCLGKPYHVDHIFPLIKGGLHHHLNLQVIPQKFNSQKHDLLSYYNPMILDFTDLDRTLLREMFVNAEKLGCLQEIKDAIASIKLQKKSTKFI